MEIKYHTIYLFDVTSSNINRILIPFANLAIELNFCKNAVILAEELVDKINLDKKSCSNKVLFSSFKNEKEKIVKLHSKKIILFTFGYRIADLYYTKIFNDLNISTVQIQHGMYQDFLKRSFFGYFKDLRKKLFYLKILFYFAFSSNKYLLLYLLNKDFIKSKIINEKYKFIFSKKIKSIRSNTLYLWGSSWWEWFVDNHFYSQKENYRVMGNPDYNKFIKSQKNQPYYEICYNAQTFVEDGRMEADEYKKILIPIAKAFGEKLCVKMHPRSNHELYSSVTLCGGKLINEFPKSKIYIGHYSSLLALALSNKATVYLININNESIPYYFIRGASKVFSSAKSLVKYIKFNKKYHPCSDEYIKSYFLNREVNPYKFVIEDLKIQ